MAFSQEFLEGRNIHLVAKLAKTREALLREGLLFAAVHHKIFVLIPQIVAAIERIKEDVYGSCHDCGIEIAEARLLHHPHVERCVHCQDIAEKVSRSSRA